MKWFLRLSIYRKESVHLWTLFIDFPEILDILSDKVGVVGSGKDSLRY